MNTPQHAYYVIHKSSASLFCINCLDIFGDKDSKGVGYNYVFIAVLASVKGYYHLLILARTLRRQQNKKICLVVCGLSSAIVSS